MKVLTRGEFVAVDQPSAAGLTVPDLFGEAGGARSVVLSRDSSGRRRAQRFSQIAKANPWVRQAVNARAGPAARTPFHVYLPDGEGGWVRVRPGESSQGANLADLLEHPAPGMSSLRWRRKVLTDVLVHGMALAEQVKSASRVQRLVWHPWRDVLPHLTDDGLDVEAYEIPTVRTATWDGTTQPSRMQTRFLDPADVVVFGHFDDVEGPLAVSPLESLRATHRLHDAVWRFAAAFLDQGVHPSGIMELPAGATPDQARITREMIEKLHAGVDNAGRPLVGFGSWKPMAHTPQAAQLVDLARQSKEEVAAAYGLPNSQQDSSSANRATSQVDREAWLRDVVGTDVAMLEHELMAQLVRTSTSWRAAGLKVEAQLAEQLRPDMVALSQVIEREVGGAVMTPNEGRKLIGLPQLKDPAADQLLLKPGTPERDGV